MAREIRNLLKEGLPSKIYLIIYTHEKSVSGFKIAQIMQGKKRGEVPQTSKVYAWLKKLKGQAMILETEQGYAANIEPLLEEIKVTLKNNNNIELSDLEFYMIKKLLSSYIFKRTIKEYSEKHKNYFRQEVDAAFLITNTLGEHALRELQGANEATKEFISASLSPDDYNFEIKTPSDFEKKIILFSPKLDITVTWKKGKEELMPDQGELVPPLEIIFPKSLLEKLCNLSATYVLSQIIASESKQREQLIRLWKTNKENTNV